MFKCQRYLGISLRRGFSNRKNFTGRYKVAKEEKYEGIKNKPVYDKAMKRGLEHDPELEFNDYLELDTDYNQTYSPETEEMKNKKLQSYLDNKTSVEDKLKEYLLNAKDDNEMLFKSEKMIDSFRRKDMGSLFAEDKQEILDQYNRYEYYQKNYVKTAENHEMKLQDEDKVFRNKKDHRNDGLNDFYKNLDSEITKHLSSNYVAKNLEALSMLKDLENKLESVLAQREVSLNNLGSRDVSNFELIDLQKKLAKEFETNAAKSTNKIKGPVFEKQFIKSIDNENEQDPVEIAEEEVYKVDIQLSLRSKIEIHKLYLQGWSIKDICVRFGVSPQRAKLVLWTMQYFLEDVLPYLTPEQLIERIYMELNPAEDTNIVDYGIDLEQLNKFQGGMEVKVMAKNLMDHIPKTNREAGMTEKEIQEKLEKIKTKKEDFVIEKIVSTDSPPYYLKNWIVYRGHGMMRVNRMFKKIVERSHYKGHFPLKVAAKLDQGPRIASIGFGVK